MSIAICNQKPQVIMHDQHRRTQTPSTASSSSLLLLFHRVPLWSTSCVLFHRSQFFTSSIRLCPTTKP
ncbi:hypothetical protein UPYG_G00032930 [Umbra pygmaea]|uniref:Uncharacterized protein n=1 Tax=Umbra pygmaea TaxID=75934 RepID=A0ABD0YA90_UMBPY